MNPSPTLPQPPARVDDAQATHTPTHPPALPALIATVKAGRTWAEVAAYLGEYSGAFWRLIANGERHATIEQENIVRAACGLPAVTQSPAEAVAEAGIDRVVRCSKRPNTAILAAVTGDITLVRLQVSKAGDDVPATIPVTLSYGHAGTRRKRLGTCVPYLSKMDIAGLETIHGKTGNLAEIAAAAQRARAAFDS